MRPSSAGRSKLEMAVFTSVHVGFFFGGFVDLPDFIEVISLPAIALFLYHKRTVISINRYGSGR
jgi:hypothetical protein